MSALRTAAQDVITSFLVRLGRPVDSLEDGTALHNDGLDLDSLETAELSVLLEDELGRDPFTDGPLPTTLGDIYAFYDGSVREA